MPNIRVMLWAALAAILFLNYEAWMQDYPASPGAGSPAAGTSTTAAGGNSPVSRLGDSVPQAAAPSAAAPPTAAQQPVSTPPGAPSMPAPVDAGSAAESRNAG